MTTKAAFEHQVIYPSFLLVCHANAKKAGKECCTTLVPPTRLTLLKSKRGRWLNIGLAGHVTTRSQVDATQQHSPWKGNLKTPKIRSNFESTQNSRQSWPTNHLFDHAFKHQVIDYSFPFSLSCQRLERRHGRECWTTLVPPTRATDIAEGRGRWLSMALLAQNIRANFSKCWTKRQNELYSEVWKIFSQSSTDVPALLSCAMLPWQARGTFKKQFTKPTVQFILSLSRWVSIHHQVRTAQKEQ